MGVAGNSTIQDCVFEETSSFIGGAISVFGRNGDLSLRNNTFSRSSADKGGVISIDNSFQSGSVTVEDCWFADVNGNQGVVIHINSVKQIRVLLKLARNKFERISSNQTGGLLQTNYVSEIELEENTVTDSSVELQGFISIAQASKIRITSNNFSNILGRREGGLLWVQNSEELVFNENRVLRSSSLISMIYLDLVSSIELRGLVVEGCNTSQSGYFLNSFYSGSLRLGGVTWTRNEGGVLTSTRNRLSLKMENISVSEQRMEESYRMVRVTESQGPVTIQDFSISDFEVNDFLGLSSVIQISDQSSQDITIRGMRVRNLTSSNKGSILELTNFRDLTIADSTFESVFNFRQVLSCLLGRSATLSRINISRFSDSNPAAEGDSEAVVAVNLERVSQVMVDEVEGADLENSKVLRVQNSDSAHLARLSVREVSCPGGGCAVRSLSTRELTLSDSQFQKISGGGALSLTQTEKLSLTGCSFSQVSSRDRGGSISLDSTGSTKIGNLKISDSTSEASGGCLAVKNALGDFIIEGSTF